MGVIQFWRTRWSEFHFWYLLSTAGIILSVSQLLFCMSTWLEKLRWITERERERGSSGVPPNPISQATAADEKVWSCFPSFPWQIWETLLSLDEKWGQCFREQEMVQRSYKHSDPPPTLFTPSPSWPWHHPKRPERDEKKSNMGNSYMLVQGEKNICLTQPLGQNIADLWIEFIHKESTK